MATVYLITWAHFVSDFILQSDAMAKGKSSSNRWLGKHIAAYTAALGVFAFFGAASWKGALAYALANGAAHFATDYVTSRMTKRLWEQKRVHDFFVVIGFDQAVHLTTLVATIPLLGMM